MNSEGLLRVIQMVAQGRKFITLSALLTQVLALGGNQALMEQQLDELQLRGEIADWNDRGVWI